LLLFENPFYKFYKQEKHWIVWQINQILLQ